MKRMSDVFKLPVSVDHYGLNDANSKTLIDGYDALEVHLNAAAHALNHVDALADALDVCIEILGDMPAELMQNVRAYNQASAALAAYRGDK